MFLNILFGYVLNILFGYVLNILIWALRYFFNLYIKKYLKAQIHIYLLIYNNIII